MTLITIPAAAPSGGRYAGRRTEVAPEVGDARARFSAAGRSAALTSAWTGALAALADAAAGFGEDPYPESYESRLSVEVERIREAFGRDLAEAEARKAFEAVFAPLAERALLGVAKLARENRIRFSLQRLDVDLATLAGLSAAGPLGLDRAEVVALGDRALDLAHSTGLIGTAEREERAAAFRAATDALRARAMLASAPDALLSALEVGAFPALDPADRVVLRREAAHAAAPRDETSTSAAEAISRVLAAAGRDGAARARAGSLGLKEVRQLMRDLNRTAEAVATLPDAEEQGYHGGKE